MYFLNNYKKLFIAIIIHMYTPPAYQKRPQSVVTPNSSEFLHIPLHMFGHLLQPYEPSITKTRILNNNIKIIMIIINIIYPTEYHISDWSMTNA